MLVLAVRSPTHITPFSGGKLRFFGLGAGVDVVAMKPQGQLQRSKVERTRSKVKQLCAMESSSSASSSTLRKFSIQKLTNKDSILVLWGFLRGKVVFTA